MYTVSEKTKQFRAKRIARFQINDALKRGVVTPEDIGVKGQLTDTAEYAWDNEDDSDENTERVQIVRQDTSGYDIERFIMSLPEDEGRVLAVRTMGFDGVAAAEMAGFSSVWSYIRALRKLRIRVGVAKEIAI